MPFRYYGNPLYIRVDLSDKYMEPQLVWMSKSSTLQQSLKTKQTSKQPELLHIDKINSWLQGGLTLMKSKPSWITSTSLLVIETTRKFDLSWFLV